MTAKKSKKAEEPKIELVSETEPEPEEQLVKCVNCEVWLPRHTGVCPNCSYRQRHPGW